MYRSILIQYPNWINNHWDMFNLPIVYNCEIKGGWLVNGIIKWVIQETE